MQDRSLVGLLVKKIESNSDRRVFSRTVGPIQRAIQTIGYFYWENPMDPQKAMANAMDYLEEFAYRKIWSELSRKDKEVVLAVSKVKNGEIMRIREVLHYSTNQFNPYRNRLIKAGIICSPLNGIVEFALPGFGEFAERVTEEGSI